MVEFARWNPEERALVNDIVGRAAAMCAESGVPLNTVHLRMDLSAVHATCPIDVARLAGFPDFDFAHDVGGIMRYLDRATGELTRCFVPRCALPEGAESE